MTSLQEMYTAYNASLAEVLAEIPYVIELPTTLKGTIDSLVERRRVIQRVAVQSRNGKATADGYCQVACFLSVMDSLEYIDPRMK